MALVSVSYSNRLVFSVRRARNAGEAWRLRKTVSVSLAWMTAFFQFSWTGDSTADTMRVPICTPSAPKAKAAAMERPSTKPPAAMMGTSTWERTKGSSTMLATSRGFLKPPPSPPSTTKPSTPQATAFLAAPRLGTTWKTVRPAFFNSSV